VPSLLSNLLPLYFRATRGNRIFASAEAAEKHMAARSQKPRSHQPPRSLRRDVSVEIGTRGGWPVYTVMPRAGSPVASGSVDSPRSPVGSVVYLHGGAWVNEVAVQHWHLVAQIAAEANTTVILPIYPLVPKGTALTVNDGVVDLALTAQRDFGSVALAGDSAGGQIAITAALTLRNEHQISLPLTVLISPAVDPSMKNPQMDVVQPSDPWLAKPGNVVFLKAWRAGISVDDPRVNALEADLRGLGPLLLFSGTRDILNPDARLLVDRARDAGVDVDYREIDGLLHVYPLTPTREGSEARRHIVTRLAAALAAALA